MVIYLMNMANNCLLINTCVMYSQRVYSDIKIINYFTFSAIECGARTSDDLVNITDWVSA